MEDVELDIQRDLALNIIMDNIAEFTRENSNRNYVFNAKDSFQEDFNKIKTSMENRSAPEAQFKQLNEIYDRYITYLSYIKYQENNGLCIED